MLYKTLNQICKLPLARKFIWRAGRAMYQAARGDVPNNPRSNGEYWLLDHVIRNAQPGERMLDVGANQGDWSLEAIRLGALGRGCKIEAFEPSRVTRVVLSERTSGRVTIHPIALSDVEGFADFYDLGNCSGINSLIEISGASRYQVKISTLDAFLGETQSSSIKMVKIDTEGFDLLVMRGAISLLSAGSIEIVQFEYNWRWLPNHVALRDVFELVATLPYHVGKLAGPRIEFFDSWHPELERFFESNFVLVKRGSPLETLGVHMSFDASNSLARRQ